MRLPKFLLLAVPALLAGAASAHHSFSMFDRSTNLVLNGTVKDFQWTNPHSWIEVLVKDPSGKTIEWGCAMGSPGNLLRTGWKPHSLVPGDAVTVTINPMKDGERAGSVVSVYRADGTRVGH